MKFCVIGDNPTALPILRLLASGSGSQLGACHLTGPLSEQGLNLQLPIRTAGTAEDAFLTSDIQAVVLAVTDLEDQLRLARSVSQAEKLVLAVPPPNCAPAFSFELHLILDESRTAIVPWLGRDDLIDLAAEHHLLALDPLTTLQLALELPMASTTPHDLRDAVCRGLDILSATGFRYAQVTAIESQAPDGTFISRLITLNAQPTAEQPLPPATLMLSRSTAAPKSGNSDNTLTLRQMLTDGTHREFSIRPSSSPALPTLISRIELLSEKKELSSRWMDAFSSTLELAEAVDKSLRRRRTVDVHFDTGSERGVFKSQMTAIGCGVLTYMMFGMVAYLIVAQLLELPDWALHLGRILWVAPLVLFLIAQFLLPLTRERAAEKSAKKTG